MRKLILFLLLSSAVFAQPVPNPAGTPERHEFTIANFKTESGVTLPVGAHRLRNIRTSQRRQGQRHAAAVALHGEPARI